MLAEMIARSLGEWVKSPREFGEKEGNRAGDLASELQLFEGYLYVPQRDLVFIARENLCGKLNKGTALGHSEVTNLKCGALGKDGQRGLPDENSRL